MWRTFLTEQRDFVHGVGVLEDVIDEVRVPSVVLADPADTLIPVATAYALPSRLPASELQLVTFGGHNLPRRNPEAVAGAIINFTAALPPVTPRVPVSHA